jgi:hypothetical protein
MISKMDEQGQIFRVNGSFLSLFPKAMNKFLLGWLPFVSFARVSFISFFTSVNAPEYTATGYRAKMVQRGSN